MKKLILLAFFGISTGICTAQVSFGIQAGANVGMGKFKYNDQAFNGYTSHEQKNQVKIGFLGGVVAEIPIGSSLAFRPELNFMQEGTKQTVTGTTAFFAFSQEQKVSLNYIQVPLNVVYKVPVGSNSVFFGLGPVVELGLSGKVKAKYVDLLDASNNENRTFDVKFDGKKSDDITDPNDDDAHLKRVDVGLDVLAGFRMGMGVFIKVAYSHGFMSLDPNKDNADVEDRSTYKNSGVSVSVGYMFGGGGKKK